MVVGAAQDSGGGFVGDADDCEGGEGEEVLEELGELLEGLLLGGWCG